MPPDDPGGRARGIDEDAIERTPPIPEVAGRADVSDFEGGRTMQALQVFLHPRETACVDIDRNQFEVGREFEQVCRFPAGSRARIQHPHARLTCQQRRGELSTRVLNGDPSVGETGHGRHRHRLLELYGCGCPR